ncbi:MAG: T9SS C-terminal target domain-containing protein, partial [Bacteroidetes bacterium]
STRSIDTDNLQSGIYLLRLNAGGEEVILKLVLR